MREVGNTHHGHELTSTSESCIFSRTEAMVKVPFVSLEMSKVQFVSMEELGVTAIAGKLSHWIGGKRHDFYYHDVDRFGMHRFY